MPQRTSSASSFYSYSAKRSLRQEEVAAYKRIALVTVLIVVLLVGGFFLGVPLLAHLGAGSSTIPAHSPLGTTDNIPPTAPRLDSLPDITRIRTLTVSGNAESGSQVAILVNDKQQVSTLADKTGQFKGDINLSSGENSITTTATDSVGNKSRASKAVIVTYDATPPKLTLISPATDQTTSTAGIVSVSGKTESTANVTVNDRQVIVQNDGSFSTTVILSAGDNTVTVVATDSAGNLSKIIRSVNYAQASPSATPAQ